MYIYQSNNSIPIKIWSQKNSIEQGAITQIENTAKLPFAFHHVALMPDGHQGYGAPIGGVLATKNVIVVNFVGVDIGCGMCAVRTSLKNITQHQIKTLFGGSKGYKGGIRTKVPVGFSHQSKKQNPDLMPKRINYSYCSFSIISQQYESALKQIGTLGGGNHFIEIQKGIIDCDWCKGGKEKSMYLTSPPREKICKKCKGTGKIDGNIWIMIHSGSRNLGYKVAKHYNEVAKKLNEKWYSSVPKEFDLAFLPLNSEEGQSYLKEMNYCVEFAFANRKLMMDKVMETFKEQFSDITFEPIINIAHNYAQMENHFGQNVMVHRKGATSAKEGQLGIIPGSQGTKSYIVRGKGNPESFMSCSHGAGRTMSRTKARETLNLEEEITKLDKQGIVHSIRNKKDLDEASSAYKPIDEVMENQKDLVEIVVELTPIGVIKG